jgi:hypothetical protein
MNEIITYKNHLQTIINSSISAELKNIATKVFNNERITFSEAVLLYQKAELGYLGVLANYIRFSKNKNYVYFNHNFHVEPTNVCVYSCSFCSYSRLIKNREQGWELNSMSRPWSCYHAWCVCWCDRVWLRLMRIGSRRCLVPPGYVHATCRALSL